jgi:signal transduction histidine kinase
MTNTGKLRDLEGRQSQLLRLVELSMTLNSTLDLDQLLQLIVATATELLECEGASILLYDDKNMRLYFAAATGADPVKLAEIPVPIENSLAGTIFRTNQPMILNNVEEDPRHYSLVSDQVQFKTRSLLGVPMLVKGRAMGVLEAINKRDGEFAERDVSILSVTAAHAAIAIDNARLFQQTQQALQKVRETNSIKSHFLSLASHELRTPLGIIIGYATFLQEDARDETSDHAQHVLNAASQMRSLLDQMNNLTLLQADELDILPHKISIQDILTFAADEIMYFVARRNLEITYAFGDEPLYVNVDQEKTTLAFVNLISNAVRFSYEGGKIVIGAVDQGDGVLAWVQDNGTGIPANKLQKVFEEFYQIEPPNTRSYGGLGIGLTIAKGIIEIQGGGIWAESEGAGKGATFKVTLPKA